ncbi:MAG: O-sialoglycoprotein endopeptidase [Desulfitobacteriia bacterium]
MLFLGIDTSAYTSSVAIVNHKKELVMEKRKVLEVRMGERGLAQSEALFKHLQVLPRLLDFIPSDYWSRIKCLGVSIAPRPVEGSYMPVFTPGYAIASSLASALGVKLFLSTHQEGHLAAGLASVTSHLPFPLLALHVSGGTTELLIVNKTDPGKLKIQILGGTTDLHAGQFIDRVGVSLGLPFPAGKELEKLALKAAPGAASLLPSSVKGYKMSFSGVETAAQRLIRSQKKPADVARAVESCVARTLAKVLEKAIRETNLEKILVVGGVAANMFIRTELEKKLEKAQFFWALPEWSTDNAIGVAFLTEEAYQAGVC